jgi:hypothetical protein
MARHLLALALLGGSAALAVAQDSRPAAESSQAYSAKRPAGSLVFSSEGMVRDQEVKIRILAKGGVELQHRKKAKDGDRFDQPDAKWSSASFPTVTAFVKERPQLSLALVLLEKEFDEGLSAATASDEDQRALGRKRILAGPVALHLFWLEARASSAEAPELQHLEALKKELVAKEQRHYDLAAKALREGVKTWNDFDCGIEAMVTTRGPTLSPIRLRLMTSKEQRACILVHRDGAFEVWVRAKAAERDTYSLCRSREAFEKGHPKLFKSWQAKQGLEDLESIR